MTVRKGLIIGGIFALGILGGLAIGLSLSKTKDQDKVLSTTTQQELSATEFRGPTSNNSDSALRSDLLAKVIKVIDGDTVVLGPGQTVRLIGIDAPEKNDCFAQESTQELQRLIDGKEVRLEKDISETDRYQRLLRYIWIDQIFINDQLVRGGFAKAYPYAPDLAYKDQFAQAEKEARENNRGLWNSCQEADESANKPGLTAQPKPDLEDKDCKDFKTHAEAQAFFESAGPGDPHRLDADGDGLACESLPKN